MVDQNPNSSLGGKLTETVNPETLQFARAIKDDAQAYSIYKRMELDNRKRNMYAAAIMRKFNDEQPWNPTQLAAAGQAWRNNRSTGFFSSIIKRLIPAYIQVIDSAKFLTSSKFSDSNPQNDQKVEDFRTEITNTIRRWNEFPNFKYRVVIENVMFGYATNAWTDEFEWKPRFARNDEALFPDGTSQDAANVTLWLLKQNFLIHEMAKKLKDPQATSDAGWNVENIVKAINEAQPENRRRTTSADYRKFEDTIREATAGRSYSEGVKVIETAHLFVQEAVGTVSHYILNARTGKVLFKRFDRFQTIEECLHLMTVEVGNGKLHGSKGAGRVLYNTSVAAEQSRNLIADNLYLSGLILLKATTKGKKAAAIVVTHPICVVGEDYEVISQKFEIDIEAFMQLDKHLTQIAEIQVGAFMPTNTMGDTDRSASEINYIASVEQQIREGVLMRFWGQFQGLVYNMQKRICSEENIAEASKIFQQETTSGLRAMTLVIWTFLTNAAKRIFGMNPPGPVPIIDEANLDNKEAVMTCLELLRKGLTPADIFELAQCPPNETTQDLAAQNAQATDVVVGRYKGDPSVNQPELIRRDISSKLGNSVADTLIIPAEDNTLTVEAIRMQLLELPTLLGGEQIDVSPRDLDKVHMAVVMGKTKDVVSNLNPAAVNEQLIAGVKQVLAHFDEHLQSAMKKGMKPETLLQETQFSQMGHKLLEGASAGLATSPTASLKAPAGAMPPHPHNPMPALGAQGNSNNPVPSMAGAPGLPSVPQPLDSNKLPLSSGPKDLNPNIS